MILLKIQKEKWMNECFSLSETNLDQEISFLTIRGKTFPFKKESSRSFSVVRMSFLNSQNGNGEQGEDRPLSPSSDNVFLFSSSLVHSHNGPLWGLVLYGGEAAFPLEALDKSWSPFLPFLYRQKPLCSSFSHLSS